MGDQSKAKFCLGNVPDPFSGSFSRPQQPEAAPEAQAKPDFNDWLDRQTAPDPPPAKTNRFTNKHPNKYPGAGFSVRHWNYHDRKYPIGAHYNCSGTSSDLLAIREVAMMALVDKLTDKSNWQEKVYDDTIVAKWREEAMEPSKYSLYSQATLDKIRDAEAQENRGNEENEGYEEDEESEEDEDDEENEDRIKARVLPRPGTRIISEACFNYCIEELRSKAKFFNKQGFVHVLDSTTATVIKSDTTVSPELHNSLRTAFATLVADQAAAIDWHPRSNDMVQDLVHPSMYPLVYGYSKFIKEEVVGVQDAVDMWAGLGNTVLKEKTHVKGNKFARTESGVPAGFWSDTYQWLPANLAFQEDGTVRFTSYVNNLHPKKYPSIYRTLEKLIDIAIPAWDHCLATEGDRFPRSPRISLSEEYYEDSDDSLWEGMEDTFARCGKSLANLSFKDMRRFSDSELKWNPLFNQSERELQKNPDGPGMVQKFKEEHEESIKAWLWEKHRLPILPEPDEFSEDDHDFHSSENLRERFAETGLQVIVKMATIKLTPEKPEFPMGGWHIEGMMNEHICATALYYLDSENVTTSHLAFRTQTDRDQEDLSSLAGQDSYNWLEQVYGTALGGGGGAEQACLQYYGTVETRQAHLLAFPNTFHHRVSSFKLQDPTKPGHRRFVALWLVDPHQRIISTANVPPQQLDWWAEAAFGGAGTGGSDTMPPELLHLLKEKPGLARHLSGRQGGEIRLPNELLDMIREDGLVPEGLMDVEEARARRLKLMEERSQFHEHSKNEWFDLSYSFCEH
ncbi:hypothetical protein GQ53DRAFT_727710 [Thozetella sp. PMI_491]|nr:hypothetical protein GQ53DRAFT_727710 [Thozetella sp. PMI_491]